MSGVEVIFGVVASAISCADVAVRLGSSLAQFESDRRHAGSRVQALQKQVKNLYAVIKSVHFSLQPRTSSNRPLYGEEDRILPLIQETLTDCEETLNKFELELAAIHGPQQFEKLRNALLRSTAMTLRLRKKAGLLQRFERDVDMHFRTVQIHLSCLHE
jgi:hypothetical protein